MNKFFDAMVVFRGLNCLKTIFLNDRSVCCLCGSDSRFQEEAVEGYSFFLIGSSLPSLLCCAICHSGLLLWRKHLSDCTTLVVPFLILGGLWIYCPLVSGACTGIPWLGRMLSSVEHMDFKLSFPVLGCANSVLLHVSWEFVCGHFILTSAVELRIKLLPAGRNQGLVSLIRKTTMDALQKPYFLKQCKAAK